jgi:hypothetical protein
MASSGCQVQEEEDPTLEASEQPLGLKGSSLGMVIDNATGSATVFNADTNTILGTVQGLGFPGLPGDCSITADGTKGFFTPFNSSVTVVDLTTTVPTLAGTPNPIPIASPGFDTALSPDGKFLVVGDGGSFAPLSVIDVATQTQVSTFDLGDDSASLDVCSDGSVLVTSFFSNRVRRLRLSASGVLTDTGESLFANGPVNVYCSPAATSGIVVELFGDTATSFKIPGLTPVSTRNVGFFGLSGAINHAGDRAYVRNFDGIVNGFSFDQTTGILGAAPLFQAAVAFPFGILGVDDLAVHPSDASLYVSEPGRLRILDATTGVTTGSITGGSLVQPTGVCFGAVLPNEPPVAKCADRIVPADGTCHAAASIDDGSFDPDEGDTIQCTQIPSGPFDEGTTKVTLTCTDSEGESSSCTATVTVADQAPPDLACPADQTLECNDGNSGAIASFIATASDNCDGETAVTCVPASGSTFPLGTTAGVCSSSDDSGNTSRCSHNVTVVDTAPPTVVTANPAPLWPPNHKYHRIDLDACIDSIQDACRGPLDIAANAKVTGCTSDEPDNGLGDGDSANDCVIVDDHSVDLRAERAGNGNGRVYTIRYTVSDGSSAIDHTCKVGVPHRQNGDPAIDDAL